MKKRFIVIALFFVIVFLTIINYRTPFLRQDGGGWSVGYGSSTTFPEKMIIDAKAMYSIEKLKGKYGFVDAYNLDKNWFDSDVIGIDKGISLLMLANYQDDIVHTNMMKNKHILDGLDRLQIKKNG